MDILSNYRISSHWANDEQSLERAAEQSRLLDERAAEAAPHHPERQGDAAPSRGLVHLLRRTRHA